MSADDPRPADDLTPDYPLIQPMPEGVTPLTADEAAEAITLGDHPETDAGFVAMDTALIDLLRCGAIKGGRFPDGQLGYGLTEHGANLYGTLQALGMDGTE